MNDKKDFKFSIITPTYNRCDLLNRIFYSLQKEKAYVSEWIIIDDGSQDQTKQLILNFKKESSLKIVFEYSENRGMTHAINLGLKYVNGDYFFKLDSDDYLLENSLEKIHNAINKILKSKYRNQIKAFSFLASKPNGKIINKFKNLADRGKLLDEKIIISNYLSARFMNLISGDLLDIFKSYPLLNHFRYPIFSNERHCPSGYISYFCSDYFNGDVAYILENVLIKDYQSDGISSQRKKYHFNIPNNNLKSYLLTYLYLINISSDKLIPFFKAFKIIFKTWILLFFSLIKNSIRLIHIKIMKKL